MHVPDDGIHIHADEGAAHGHEHEDVDDRPFSGHSDMGHVEQRDHL